MSNVISNVPAISEQSTIKYNSIHTYYYYYYYYY